MRREFKIIVELKSYEMDGVMLDLGSNVHIVPKKSQEFMGKRNLVWFPIQLKLTNQYKIYPIGRLEKVEVNIGGVKKLDFEVTEIMDDSDPYPSLLGMDWEFDNNVVLNLKKRKFPFETNTLHVIAPLDSNEGDIYNEPMNEDV
jgi:hypothetical protein